MFWLLKHFYKLKPEKKNQAELMSHVTLCNEIQAFQGMINNLKLDVVGGRTFKVRWTARKEILKLKLMIHRLMPIYNAKFDEHIKNHTPNPALNRQNDISYEPKCTVEAAKLELVKDEKDVTPEDIAKLYGTDDKNS